LRRGGYRNPLDVGRPTRSGIMMMATPGQFNVGTEDELMQQIQIHAKAAHPDLPMTPEFQRQVKSLIKTV